MDRWSSSTGRVGDLVAVAIAAVLTLGVTFLLPTGILQAIFVILFLLFGPGYAVVAALIPRRASPFESEIPAVIERIFLTMTTSIALAVIVTINIEFTRWLIRPRPVVLALTMISLFSVLIAAIRRWRHDDASHSLGIEADQRVRNARSGGNGIRLASLAVVIAVLAAVLSVGVVTMDSPRGERYTEFGLLTGAEDGSLVAEGYPSEIALGEREDLYFTVTNQENQPMEYTVVVILTQVDENGETVRQAELDTYRDRVAAGDTWQREHSVRPVLEGENLRLNYLLYKSTKPSQPAVGNSYRNLHIWINVTAD